MGERPAAVGVMDGPEGGAEEWVVEDDEDQKKARHQHQGKLEPGKSAPAAQGGGSLVAAGDRVRHWSLNSFQRRSISAALSNHHWPGTSHCTALLSGAVGKVAACSGVTKFPMSGLGPG
jgi:hypothetical protein